LGTTALRSTTAVEVHFVAAAKKPAKSKVSDEGSMKTVGVTGQLLSRQYNRGVQKTGESELVPGRSGCARRYLLPNAGFTLENAGWTERGLSVSRLAGFGSH
jgi:hypothetical protein